MKKCHICDNPKVEELETVKFPDGVLEAYYCKPNCGCRVAAQPRLHADAGESADLEGESTPEVESTSQADT